MEEKEELELCIRVLEREMEKTEDERTRLVLSMSRDFLREKVKNPKTQVVIRVSFLRGEEALGSFYEEGIAQDEDDLGF